MTLACFLFSFYNQNLKRFCRARRQGYLYYYCSNSCFLTKILHCAFLSREALSQPPQPPEPFASSVNQRLVSPLIPLDIVGPAARLSVCSVSSVD